MSASVTRSVFVIAVAVLLITPSIGTAATATTLFATDRADEAASSPSISRTADVVHQRETSTNNSSVRHENPDEAASEGDLVDLRRWLATRIGDAFVSCAQALGTNGTTCEALREEFPSLASRYAEVAGATDEPQDDNVSRVLNQTAERQLAFVQAVREYRTTLAAYREARRQNQPQRAQELARQLSRRGDRVTGLGGQLSTGYGVIADNGTIVVSEARTITQNVTANVSETTDEIRTREFDPPELTVASNVSTVSFVDPARIRGRLRTTDGTPLVNRTVVVRVANTTFRTRTDADGAFDVTYRPTAASTGPATVVAQYVPQNGSQYTTVEARTDVSVTASEGTIRIEEEPSASNLTFGDELRVGGTLRVDGQAAADVPIAVTLGDVRLGVTETNESGAFTHSEPLPATVPNGTPTLDVSVAGEGRAVTAESASTTVRVAQTTPGLTVRAARADADTVRLSGRLAVDDVAVSGARLAVRRGNETLDTVRLGQEGSFDAEVSLPDVPADESAALTVAYEPSGGNLAPVDVRIEVRSAPREGGLVPDVGTELSLGWLDDLDPTLLALVGLVVLGGLLVVSGIGSRSRVRSVGRAGSAGSGRLARLVGGIVGTGGGADASERELGDTPAAEFESEVAESDTWTGILDEAERLREERPDAAIVGAYAAVRRRLDARFGVDPTLTHWELLTTYRGALDGESRDALERLTVAYERAAFSSAQSTADAVEAALDDAGIIVEDDSTPADEPSSGAGD